MTFTPCSRHIYVHKFRVVLDFTLLQAYPLMSALYVISVRRLRALPTASFRFHLTLNTLAVQLTLPTTKRVVDFHHQAIAHGGRTTKKPSLI